MERKNAPFFIVLPLEFTNVYAEEQVQIEHNEPFY